MKPHVAYFFISLFLFVSCSNDPDSNSSGSSDKVFQLLTPRQTGIDFNNKISQTAELNVLNYSYFLNGAGVASGDFNNDGLPDLFFTANQEDDRLYLNKGKLQFDDISEKAGINSKNKDTWSTGVTLVDINQDGWLDIYVCKAGAITDASKRANLLYLNNGDLTFTEKAATLGINDMGFSNQATFFDYDRDGDLDLYVMNHSYYLGSSNDKEIAFTKDPKVKKDVTGNLYRNSQGQFAKVTERSGLLDYAYGLGLASSDWNKDGWIDLYVTSDFCIPDLMYQNKGAQFTNVTNTATQHISFYGMGLDIADFNNDALPDISVLDMAPPDQLRSKTLMPSMDIDAFWHLIKKGGFQHQYMFNSLQLNHGNGHFSEIAKLSGVHKTDWSWAVLMADFDNDGLKDKFVTNGFRTEITDNDLTNQYKARRAQLGGKISNEERKSWLDKMSSQKLLNPIFKNTGDLKFKQVNEDWGISKSSWSNGAIYVDLDRDGDLEIVVNNIDEAAFVYQNNTVENTQNNWIDIQFKGYKSNQNGLNTKVTLYTNGQVQYQELTRTRGYLSAVDDVLHFGLGATSTIDSIVIEWIDSKKQVLLNSSPNQLLTINHKDAKPYKRLASKDIASFKSVNPSEKGITFSHQENEYDDFKKELLLPHKNSQHGPHISVGDVNGDQLDDFYIGGAAGQAGKLYIQNKDAKFTVSSEAVFVTDAASEDINSVFIDVDQDKDLDLYVVSGGNEFEKGANSLQDRLYLNNGKGQFTKTTTWLPAIKASGSVAVTHDFNKDGKQDLFVGARMIPGQYPMPDQSVLLINKGNKFIDETATFNAELSQLGLITDALTVDITGNGEKELVVVGEWMSPKVFTNSGTALTDITPTNLQAQEGWWSSVAAADIDGDGDQDLLAGNLGLNYKYKAKKEAPFYLYAHDFDQSGTLDIVLGYFNDGVCYPLRGRECSSQQMPFIKDKFPLFKDFATADLNSVYGDALQNAVQLKATNFASSIFINTGNGAFEIKKMPTETQFSSINAICIEDMNQDGQQDLLMAGNLFVSEVETPRNDAGVGNFLVGKGNGAFENQPVSKSGLFLPNDVKDLKKIHINGQVHYIVANNDGPIQLFQLN